METWKIIVAGVLILVGFNLLAYGHVKRRIAAAKAEGYRRQREGHANEGGAFFEGSDASPHKTDIRARNKGDDWHDNFSGNFGDDGGDDGRD